MIGRSECLDVAPAADHWKANGLDLSPLLHQPDLPPARARGAPCANQDAGAGARARPHAHRAGGGGAERQTPVEIALPIRNTDRTAGTLLGYEITRRYGGAGLPDDTIRVSFTGAAGQSFGAFLPRGVTLSLEGEANDFVGKGLSGGRIVVRPPRTATFVAEDNVIIGNVALYGATSGEAFVRGVAGERFAVRNSGAQRGRRGRRRSRLRIHDRRPRRRPRTDRTELRRRDERRRRLRARSRRVVRPQLQPPDGRPRASRERRRDGRWCTSSSRGTPCSPAVPSARGC